MKNPTTFFLPKVPEYTNKELADRLQSQLNNKTKPLGSLGRLETLALRIGLILGTEYPVLKKPQMLVCAADHGLTAEGISAYPSDVTWRLILQISLICAGIPNVCIGKTQEIFLPVIKLYV